jgi:uncharacterized protein YlxW (UPF0749 family)
MLQLRSDLKRNILILLLITILFGFLVTKQLDAKVRVDQATSDKSINDIASQVAETIKANKKLREDLDSLNTQKATLLDTSSSKASSDEAISKEINQLKIITGQTDVVGSGVVIKFQNSLQLTQMVDLINALRNIGSDAISINNNRIIATTPLNSQMGSSPVTIKVIGDKKVLSDSLLRSGGIIEQIDDSGKVTQEDNIEIPKVRGKNE